MNIVNIVPITSRKPGRIILVRLSATKLADHILRLTLTPKRFSVGATARRRMAKDSAKQGQWQGKHTAPAGTARLPDVTANT